MAETMIERVAKAINEAETGYQIELLSLVIGVATYRLQFPGEQQMQFPSHQEAYEYVLSRWSVNRARAAIEAMREPTLEMQNAAWRWFDLNGYPTEDIEVAPPFRAMIDQALKGKEG